QLLDLLRAQLRQGDRAAVARVQLDVAGGVDETRPVVAQARQAGGGLAGPGLAHEAQDPAAVQVQGDAVEDLVAAHGAHVQAIDAEDGGQSRLRLCWCGGHAFPTFVEAFARAIASASRLVPIVSTAIAATGRMTPHGWMLSAIRFSLIMRPQSAVGGCMPSPRKDRDAIEPIE